MDNNITWAMDQRIKRVIENLEKNNIEAYYVSDEKAVIEKISEFVKEGDTISVGGSMTLFETGVIEFLKNGTFNYLDRYKEGLTPADIKSIFIKSFSADAYFVSCNAITEEGELFNVDCNGNRVAAMLYGPDKVIVIAGVNKIVRDVHQAVERNKGYSAPANAKRLKRNTPCTKAGYCMECSSTERICNDYVLIRKQVQKGRIKVILVGKGFGY